MLEQRLMEGQVKKDALKQAQELGNNVIPKNRGKLDIIADMIRSCEGGCTKSTIMLRANLNSVTATNMLKKLVKSGLIDVVEEMGNIIFFPTTKGIKFLKDYENLVTYIGYDVFPRNVKNIYLYSAFR